MFEFSATGGIFPMADFRTVKLLKYVTEWDYFGLACELIFAGFVAYYTVEEVLEIRKHKFVYFTYVWNLLDIAVLVVSFYSFKKYFQIILWSKNNSLFRCVVS